MKKYLFILITSAALSTAVAKTPPCPKNATAKSFPCYKTKYSPVSRFHGNQTIKVKATAVKNNSHVHHNKNPTDAPGTQQKNLIKKGSTNHFELGPHGQEYYAVDNGEVRFTIDGSE